MSKKIIFFCRGEDCLDVFAEKMNKIFSNFSSAPRQNAVIVIDDKEEHKSKKFLIYVVINVTTIGKFERLSPLHRKVLKC